MLPVTASQQPIGIPPNWLKNISTRYFNTNNGGKQTEKQRSQRPGNNRRGSGDNRIPREGDPLIKTAVIEESDYLSIQKQLRLSPTVGKLDFLGEKKW